MISETAPAYQTVTPSVPVISAAGLPSAVYAPPSVVLPPAIQAFAQVPLQIPAPQITQATSAYIAAAQQLQAQPIPGVSFGIAVPAGTAAAAALLGIPYVPQTTIRIRGDVTGEIRTVPLDYYNANANTIYANWTPV